MLRIKLAGCGVVVLMSLLFQAEAYAIEYRMKPGLALYRWTEKFDQGTPKETGPMGTFEVSIVDFPSVRIPELTLRGDIGMFLARVRYQTFAQNLGVPLNTHTSYLGFTSEGSVGGRNIFGAAEVEPFLGLGLRWWARVIESTDSASGYPEFYTLVYGRVGVAAAYRDRPGLTLHTAVSLDPMLWAQERIDWVGITGERLTVQNGNRVGWTLQVGLQGPTVDGTLYWRAIRLGESNFVPCRQGTRWCSQPESHQDIIGLSVAFEF